MDESEISQDATNIQLAESEVDLHVLRQVLTAVNYKAKFCQLLKSEKLTRAKILKREIERQLSRKHRQKDYQCYGYLNMSGDQIAYVSQAAQDVRLMVDGHRHCSADILQENYDHTEKKLYIGLSSGDCVRLSIMPTKVFVSFTLKQSYFKGLVNSVNDLSNHVVKRLMLDKPFNKKLDEFSAHQASNPTEQYKRQCSPDQLQALKLITSSSTSEPVVIIGPFGTGKTRILALASHFLFTSSSKKSKILVCTHQRVSADTFLEAFLSLKDQLSPTKHENDVEIFLVRNYGFRNKKIDSYYQDSEHVKEHCSKHHDSRYLIVTTCLTAPHLKESLKGFFTHIMIDEGAQMREPEAVGPLCMADSTTRIVIAGDPHQVGPSIEVLGEEASNNGLALSLLERLCTKYNDWGLNPPLVTMVTNFRCHPDILSLVGNLFYTNTTPLKLPDDYQSLPYHRDLPCFVFICSDIDDKVEGVQQTTNPLEATIILDQLMMITDYPKEYGEYNLFKVFIISQSLRQLSVIKNLAPQKNRKFRDIGYFPTYNILGRECQILFLSTSETTAADASTTNPTKSLCNPFVFNTAITRAQSLVVSVGNPFLLLKTERHMIQRYGNKGKCWSTYLQYCLMNKTFKFHRGHELKDEDRETFFTKLNTMMTANLNMPDKFHQQPTEIDSAQSLIKSTHHRLARHPLAQYELPTETQPNEAKTTATLTGDLHTVLRELYEACSKWHSFGLELKVNPSDLYVISIRFNDDPDECFKELVSIWLKQVEPKPTWTTLANALRSPTIGLNHLSEKVKNNFLPFMYTSTEYTKSPRSQIRLQEDNPNAFQCQCGKCSLLSYLDNGCPKATSHSYPYLAVDHLNEDDWEDLIQKLSADTACIIQCFADLLSIIYESLKSRGIAVSQLVKVALDLGAYKSVLNPLPLLNEERTKLQEAKSVDDALIILGKHMSFFSYGILHNIVRQMGTAEDNMYLEKYCSQFKCYCERRLFEVTASVFHASEIERKNTRSFVFLGTSNLFETLKDVKEAQRRVASLLDLRASKVQLKWIESSGYYEFKNRQISEELLSSPSSKLLPNIDRLEKTSKFDCEYEVLSILRTEQDAITFHVKAKEGGNEYALRLVKFPNKISFEDELLHRIEALKNIKEHPNIICYSSLWVERAPSDWIHRKNWSHLKNVTPCFSSHQHQPNASAVPVWDSSADEPPLVFITLTESMCKESLADWLLRTKQDRPMDVIVNFFEQILNALCYLHEDIQVTHRNLNPSSIYVETDNNIKIADFGLNHTTFSASPDPFNDEKQADIYALGATFYELLNTHNMEKVEILSKLKEGSCDIKGVDKVVVEFIQCLTCANPKERPTAIAAKKYMMKEIQASLMSTRGLYSSIASGKVPLKQTSELDDTVFPSDLVDKNHSAFQIECPVCLQILVEPIQVQCCGNNVCSACIKRIRDESSTCPCCKQNDYNYFHNKSLEQSIDKVKFFCKYQSKGCEWTGEMKERKRHITECSKRNMTCIHCNEFTSDYDDVKTNHWPVCPCYPVLCPNGCGQNLHRKAIEKHQEYTCPQTTIDCEFKVVGCREQLKRKDMPAHLKDGLLTHIFMQCQSHKQLMLNVEAENRILRMQNQKLQTDINHLQIQLKQVSRSLRGTKPVHPDISSSYGHSFPSESDSNVDVAMKGIVFSKHYVEQVINWRGATLQGEGIQLIVPENAVNSDDLVTVRLQVCSSAQFVLPDGLVLESPVFHISPTYQFQSEVTLAIEHFACIERTSDYQDLVLLSSPTKPAKTKVTHEGTTSFWKFQPYVKPTFSSDYTQAKVKLKHFCFLCLVRKKTEGHKHKYRVSLHMPLNFIPPHSHAIFCITLNHESYRMNLERYLKENFPSQKFHVACRVVKSTESKVELLVPSNLEKHYGYKIVSDMGFEIFKEEVDSVSEHLSDVKDMATYPPRLMLKFIDVQGRTSISSSRSLECKIEVKGIPELKHYHLYLVPTGSDHEELSLITDNLGIKDLNKVSTHLKDLSPQHIFELGLALGLHYPNLQKMNKFPHDMIAAWLRQEDTVPQNPPTWQTLASALESIGQTGIASHVKSEHCLSQSTTV